MTNDLLFSSEFFPHKYQSELGQTEETENDRTKGLDKALHTIFKK